MRFMDWEDDRPLLTLFTIYLVGRGQEWNSNKAINVLGWKPKWKFEDGMNNELKWLKETNIYKN
jgi:nucleoside-diphosphate-sugar epimerase